MVMKSKKVTGPTETAPASAPTQQPSQKSK